MFAAKAGLPEALGANANVFTPVFAWVAPKLKLPTPGAPGAPKLNPEFGATDPNCGPVAVPAKERKTRNSYSSWLQLATMHALIINNNNNNNNNHLTGGTAYEQITKTICPLPQFDTKILTYQHHISTPSGTWLPITTTKKHRISGFQTMYCIHTNQASNRSSKQSIKEIQIACKLGSKSRNLAIHQISYIITHFIPDDAKRLVALLLPSASIVSSDAVEVELGFDPNINGCQSNKRDERCKFFHSKKWLLL